MELMMEHVGKGLWLVLMLSLPVVLTAASIGLVVGILQAVTQVQEQTIAAAPKILFVFLVIILGGSLMLTLLTDYIREAAMLAFNEIPQSEPHILPPRPRSPGERRVSDFFKARIEDPHSDRVKNFFDQPTPGMGGGERSQTQIYETRGATQPGIGERMYLQKQSGNR
jgi:flagellar biosynthetic protein FliQ